MTKNESIVTCPIHGACTVCAAINQLAPYTGVFKMTAQAVSAAYPSMLMWVCTKHGAIPAHTCEQCETKSG